MLEYENQLFLDSVHDSELFIFAKGLSTEKVMTNLLQLYGTEAHLVFVLSADSGEEAYFLKQLKNEDAKIKSITSEYTANDRKELYAGGGVFFITSRILVVDFLKQIVPAEKITGIILFRAHNVLETSQEAFILRLFRSNNKTGFIKAFTHSPASFLLGYSRLGSVMRSCFLANVSLWPRFHEAVKESLKPPTDADGKSDDNSVIEIQLKLTEEMNEIQANLLDLVAWSVSELKRLIPALNDEDVTTDTALTKKFEKIVKAYIDPIWNTISAKSKEILNDLKIFRLLLMQLTKLDCFSFHSTLCSYTSAEAAFKSSWVLSDSAEKIITASKRRLKPPGHRGKKAKQEETGEIKKATSSEFEPEIPTKWLALSEILREICINQKQQTDPCNKTTSRLKTLILTQDVKTSCVLREYLEYGSGPTLGKIVRNCENLKIELPSDLLSKLNSIHYNKKASARPNIKKPTTSAYADEGIGEDSDDGGNEVQITLTQIERKYEGVEFLQSPVFIKPLKTFGDMDVFVVAETLENLRPDVIIIYDPDLELIRNIEIHKARVGASQTIRVYFLVFRNSIEEQIYLTSIQREKLAFERLIQEKATMVVPKEREGLDDLNQDLWRDPRKANETVTTSGPSKRNMQAAENVKDVILVDMREFRSELPSLIHKRGIDLEPITLDVGDYILTPEICVERKSVSDLIGSLNSGRLYKQAEAIGRHYKKPVLLIEHEQSGGNITGRNRNDLSQIMPKLQLLTINFPKLRIVWSPGAHYTSEVFHELKRGKPQPDPAQALAIQKDSSGFYTSTNIDPIAHGFLSKLPGVDSRNIYNLIHKCESLDQLCKLSEVELGTVLESSQNGGILYSGIHTKLSNFLVADTAGKDSIKKSKGGKIVGARRK